MLNDNYNEFKKKYSLLDRIKTNKNINRDIDEFIK